MKIELARIKAPVKLDWREEVRGINPLTTAACAAYDNAQAIFLLRRELVERTSSEGDWNFTLSDVDTSEAELNKLASASARRLFATVWNALTAGAPLPCFERIDEAEHWGGMKQVGALALIYATDTLFEEGVTPAEVTELGSGGVSTAGIRSMLIEEAIKAGQEDAELSQKRDPAKGEHAYCVSCFLNSEWGIPWDALSPEAEKQCFMTNAEAASAIPQP
jgi:hypothetical protein